MKIVISFTTIAEKMVLGWERLHCNFKTNEARRGARNKVGMKKLKETSGAGRSKG